MKNSAAQRRGGEDTKSPREGAQDMATRALLRTLKTGLWPAFLATLALAFAPAADAATPTFDANCTGCHASPPAGPRFNAGGAAAVITAANANHGMGFSAAFLTANGATLAAEIDSVFSRSQATSVNFQSSGNSIPIATLFIDNPGAVVTSTAQTAAPTRGTLGVGTPNSVTVTYSHTASDCTADSFQVHGTGSANKIGRAHV